MRGMPSLHGMHGMYHGRVGEGIQIDMGFLRICLMGFLNGSLDTLPESCFGSW